MFRNNTHTQLSNRAPILAETHESDLCKSRLCHAAMQDPREKKIMAKMAQRASRECCGYHSGYTFKRQPIGAKYLNAAAETLNYVNAKMQQKSANQKYHYMSHRVLQDLQHRCITRPAAEEWNLAVNLHSQDVKSAEFFRAYRSQEFPGGVLARRLEAEQAQRDRGDIKKVLPKIGDAEVPDRMYLRCFDDVYGFRGGPVGFGRNVYYLNA